MRFALPLCCLVFALAQASEEPRFFPAGSFSTNPRWEATTQYWYSMHLTALGEHPLCCGAIGTPVTVRFTWIRSFDNPVSIRLEHSGNGKWVVRTKITAGEGGTTNPGRLITDTTRKVSDTDAARILSKVERGSSFWTTPSAVDESDIKDGAQWIIEVLNEREYQFVDRNVADGLIRELGLTFMNLSGHKFDPVY